MDAQKPDVGERCATSSAAFYTARADLRYPSSTGHSHVDFIRIDVEGWEWETFRGIINDFTTERASPPQAANADADTPGASGWYVRERDGVLPFGQLQIELHVWNQRFQDFLEWWELLETSGLRPFHSEVRRPTGPLGLLLVLRAKD